MTFFHLRAARIGPNMRIVFQRDGRAEPGDLASLVTSGVGDDGRDFRVFRCLWCNQPIEVLIGEQYVHNCEVEEPVPRAPIA
jgi:hypothetical protein